MNSGAGYVRQRGGIRPDGAAAHGAYDGGERRSQIVALVRSGAAVLRGGSSGRHGLRWRRSGRIWSGSIGREGDRPVDKSFVVSLDT
jgi:hypothetical protein